MPPRKAAKVKIGRRISRKRSGAKRYEAVVKRTDTDDAVAMLMHANTGR